MIALPSKTTYYETETVDLTGLIISIDMGNYTIPMDASGCTYSPTRELVQSDTSITVTATAGGKSQTFNIPITVTAFPSFNDASWELSARTAQDGSVGDRWNIGDTKTEFGITYCIIGMDHDNLSVSDAKYADTSYNRNTKKAALTIQIMNPANKNSRMNLTDDNTGGWDACYMRTHNMVEYLASMSPEITNRIRTVDKVTSAGGYAESSSREQIITSEDKLFLLSGTEVFSYAGRRVLYISAKENDAVTRYAYYEAGGAAFKGDDEWLRSPLKPSYDRDHEDFCCIVREDPDNINAAAASIEFGTGGYRRCFFPAFCI